MSNTHGGLVFSRAVGESFFIGKDVEVTVYKIAGNQIKIRVVAPRSVTVLRSELMPLKIRKEGSKDAS